MSEKKIKMYAPAGGAAYGGVHIPEGGYVLVEQNGHMLSLFRSGWTFAPEYEETGRALVAQYAENLKTIGTCVAPVEKQPISPEAKPKSRKARKGDKEVK